MAHTLRSLCEIQMQHTASRIIIRLVQRQYFQEELEALRSGRPVKNSSKLSAFCPVLINEAICVGGKLKHAPVASQAIHPLLVPSEHPVAVVLIRHYREILGHAVREHVLSALRQKFWILNARALTCRALCQCVTCRKRHEGVMKQMMGDLPKARLVPRAAIHLHRALAPSTSREAKVLRKSMGASSFVSPRGPYTLRMQDHYTRDGHLYPGPAPFRLHSWCS